MSRPLKVLIVEDNALDAELIVGELTRAGFAPRFERVASAAELRERLGDGWELVVSDYSMPGFSALEALAIVEQSGLDLPFIIVSGAIGEETAVEAMRLGATDYLLKDRLGRVGPAVQRALEQARLRREHRRAREALAESEERFLRAQRMEVIGTLTSGITHDLNNVLSSMLMAAGLVKSRTREERDREMLLTIERGAQRGARMIAQLLAFSRGAVGVRTSLRPEAVIEETASLVRATFPRGIDLLVRIPRHLHAIVADVTQLHQVLMNLCVNARDAMPGGGRLTLAAENREVGEIEAEGYPGGLPGSYVVIKVADTGAGIPAEILERIFDPFFTTKEPGKGTGLGLSSVLGIVKSHGGFVTVASEVGKGSEFRVFLPASTESVSPFAGGSTVPFPMGRGELVLVVDDEDDVRKVTVELLEAQGYRVLAAASAEEALTLFLQHAEAIRVVLTNLHMPGMGGLALLQALRVLDYLKVSFLVASGEAMDAHDEELRRLGVVEFLPKPVPRARLLLAVAQAIEASQMTTGTPPA